MKITKFVVFLLLILFLLSVLSGCAGNILYGSWQLTETVDANTGEAEETMEFLANIMIFEIKRDGTVLMLDSEFGTFEKKGNEFTFTYLTDEDEESEIVSGAWELIGNDLYIYDDENPVIYHLVAVEQNDEE